MVRLVPFKKTFDNFASWWIDNKCHDGTPQRCFFRNQNSRTHNFKITRYQHHYFTTSKFFLAKRFCHKNPIVCMALEPTENYLVFVRLRVWGWNERYLQFCEMKFGELIIIIRPDGWSDLKDGIEYDLDWKLIMILIISWIITDYFQQILCHPMQWNDYISLHFCFELKGLPP